MESLCKREGIFKAVFLKLSNTVFPGVCLNYWDDYFWGDSTNKIVILMWFSVAFLN